MNIEQLIAYAERDIKGSREKIEKFAADLLENPSHAVTWSARLFFDAARLQVWNHILDQAQTGSTLKSIVEAIEPYVLRPASRAEASSSFSANQFNRELLAAYAAAYSELRLHAMTPEERELKFPAPSHNAPKRPTPGTKSIKIPAPRTKKKV